MNTEQNKAFEIMKAGVGPYPIFTEKRKDQKPPGSGKGRHAWGRRLSRGKKGNGA